MFKHTLKIYGKNLADIENTCFIMFLEVRDIHVKKRERIYYSVPYSLKLQQFTIPFYQCISNVLKSL